MDGSGDDSSTSQFKEYPQLDSDTFYRDVYSDARYYCGIMNDGGGGGTSSDDATFHLTDQQLHLPRYFTPETGARGGLFLHSTGTGKTGTALLCATRYTSAFQDARPALFLVPNDAVRNEVRCEMLGRVWVEAAHSNGQPRSFFRRTFMGDAFVDAERRRVLNEMETEAEKDRECDKLWREHICHYFELETHSRLENRVLGYASGGGTGGTKKVAKLTPSQIAENYSNRVVIVDEAHYNRNERRLYRALMSVLKCARNVRLFLLTATPMIESAEEVCPLINLLLCAEGVAESEYLTPEVVNTFVSGGAAEAENAAALAKLQWCFRGRISYVRGFDPRYFPERVDWGTSVFEGMPQHRVWPCYMSGDQLAYYLLSFMEEFKPNAEAGQNNNMWNKSHEVMRGVMATGMGVWSKRADGSKVWRALPHANWRLNRLRYLSVKLVEMQQIVEQFRDAGPALVFSDHVETGVKRAEAAFLNNGYTLWRRNNNAPPVPSVPSVPSAKTRSRRTAPPKPTLVNISGSSSSAVRKEAIKMLKSDSNYLGRHIKLVLSSPMGRTGITMRHFSVGIIDQVGWTIGDMEQLFGRLIRHGSHVHCSDHRCNKSVNLYMLCARIRASDMEALEAANPRVVRRFNHFRREHEEELRRRGFIDASDGRFLTVDERTLHIALQRDAGIAKVLRVMKEHALPLNLAQNYFSSEPPELFRHARLYEYQPEPARVPVPSEVIPSHPADVPVTPAAQDASFATLDGWFRYVCNERKLDFRGDITAACVAHFEVSLCWPIGELLHGIVRDAHVTQLEASLVLQSFTESELRLSSGGVYNVQFHLTKGWVFCVEVAAAAAARRTVNVANEVLQYQRSVGTAASAFAPPAPVTKLADVAALTNVIDADQFLGVFTERTPKINLPEACASRCVLPAGTAGSVVFHLPMDAPVCGVYNNTCDYPDVYRLKILSFTRGHFSSVAASNKFENVEHLMSLVAELDGDVAKVMGSTRKSATACKELTRRFMETGRLMPWEPGATPTLLRVLCVAKAWRVHSVVAALNTIARELFESGALEALCVVLFRLKRAHYTVSSGKVCLKDFVGGGSGTPGGFAGFEGFAGLANVAPPPNEEMMESLRVQLATRAGKGRRKTHDRRVISDYIIRVLDRLQHERQPHAMSALQYKAALEWMDMYVYGPYASALKDVHSAIQQEFARRCVERVVEESCGGGGGPE